MCLFPIRIKIWIRTVYTFSVIISLTLLPLNSICILNSFWLRWHWLYYHHSYFKVPLYCKDMHCRLVTELSCGSVASTNKMPGQLQGLKVKSRPSQAGPREVDVLCCQLIEDRQKWKAPSILANEIDPWYRLKHRNVVVHAVSTLADCQLHIAGNRRNKIAYGSNTMCFLYSYTHDVLKTEQKTRQLTWLM